MPTRLFVATPTKLLTFADCKRKYRFTYLESPRPPKGPAWAHNTVGGIVHEVLADFFGRWPAAQRTPDAVVERIRTGWRNEGFRDEAQSLEWRDRSTDMVLTYLRDSDPYYEPRGVERTVGFTTERASLRGRIDRVDERPARDGSGGTELAIVDYKTGRRPLTPTDARTSLAMALYVLGARRVLRRPCTRVELHHLPTNTVAAADHDEASLARHQSRAEAIADDAAKAEHHWKTGLTPTQADEAFPPTPSPLCAWCDYAKLCPQGRRVAPTKNPWAALEDPEPTLDD
ncbi:PD-(D/E)XK nuclease family protein [Kribbella sandramycini]|uniref:PD-(D/E)XK nuclease family protein n=1 Tax=Kribbella sandramycini TaxID=60450 RepID=A0A7Y4L2Q0_9ACTN|nr:PD-(D/E)XK nuclease family protein [Kribbella sandramycini]MBB6571307.1 RecB family exonuclease [Kribbella sandramycini]NOL43290.1 PD-(D/E)XK nuclease family protein [Kribbella sandramycini]